MEKISSVFFSFLSFFWKKKNIDKKRMWRKKKLIQAQSGSKQAGREKREEKRLVEAMTINKKKKSITYYIKAYFQGELTTEKKIIFECLLLIRLNRIESFFHRFLSFLSPSLFLFFPHCVMLLLLLY